MFKYKLKFIMCIVLHALGSIQLLRREPTVFNDIHCEIKDVTLYPLFSKLILIFRFLGGNLINFLQRQHENAIGDCFYLRYCGYTMKWKYIGLQSVQCPNCLRGVQGELNKRYDVTNLSSAFEQLFEEIYLLC